MFWLRPFILWVAFCSSCVLDAAESFTIRPTAVAVPSEVRYILTGAFGRYGGFVRNPDKDGTYSIPLESEGKPANSLKAILYARGCQFTVLSVDLRSDPTRKATFECRELSTITLRGRISPPPPGGGELDVGDLLILHYGITSSSALLTASCRASVPERLRWTPKCRLPNPDPGFFEGPHHEPDARCVFGSPRSRALELEPRGAGLAFGRSAVPQHRFEDLARLRSRSRFWLAAIGLGLRLRPVLQAPTRSR